MSRTAVTWRPARVDGQYTIVEVDLEPGCTAEVMVRTAVLNTPDGERAIRSYADRWDETREQLREGP